MIEIQVAGAGAGKTFGMAEKIIERFNPESFKCIFAITFTNAAAKNIEDAIIDQLGNLPENIKVCTVHTFLLNEIIYPFAPSILGQIYTTSTRCDLEFKTVANKPKTQNILQKERAIIIKNLKKKEVIHVDEVYMNARRIVDPSHSSHNSNKKGARINRVLSLLNSCIEKIFLDEAQDLDDTALKAFNAIGKSAVDIYMVGDPKQSIKYPTAFKDFLEEHDDSKHITLLPNNNESRRVPQTILDLSNQFCPAEQEQKSLSIVGGRLLYVVSSDAGYEDFLKRQINSDNLVSIYQKKGDYATRSSDSMPDIHPDIKELLIENNPNYDDDLVTGAATHWLARHKTELSQHRLIENFRYKFNLPNSKKTYAQLSETITRYDSSTVKSAKYHISSIERTKGLEAEVAVVILTKGIYKYLTKDNLTAKNEYNRTWNMIYVALTRTKSELVIAIDKKLINSKPSAKEAIAELEALGFEHLDLCNTNNIEDP